MAREEWTTIRLPRKRPLKAGDRLHVFLGLRTRSCRKLGLAEVKSIKYLSRGLFDISEMEAERDGFDGWEDMKKWFIWKYSPYIFKEPLEILTCRWIERTSEFNELTNQIIPVHSQ